jgi:ribonuclease VapC
MFVDASAWTAILLNEPERGPLLSKLASTDLVLTSAVATWETVRALTRATHPPKAALGVVRSLQAKFNTRVVPIDEREQDLAVEAHARFGKGVHPARLNMGDCFAYACARAHAVPLLFKGDDFSLTDIEPA